MRIFGLFGLMVGLVLVSGGQAADPPAKPHEHAHHDHGHDAVKLGDAVCVLVPTAGNQVKGAITLKQEGDALKLSGEITGLTPGEHGFHIHMFGDLRAADGASAGGHYNPDGHQHGSLESHERHAGDLGNLKADDKGTAKVDVTAKGLGLHFILGRSLVVHAKADDFKTQPSGDSGPRVAVGVIGLAEVKPADAIKK